MAEVGAHTWSCPACGRRVPLRAPACHCGTTRAKAEEMATASAAAPPRPPAPRRGASLRDELARTMTRDVKILVGGGAFVVLLGLGWLAFGPGPAPTAPVLGFVDQAPPPAAKRSPPPRPPFKLPWWK